MKTFLLALSLICLCASASADDAVKEPACVQACNVKFTKPFLKCHGVEQCENFVIAQAQSCIRHCPSE